MSDELRQHWPRPAHPRPIVVIGAGGIARDAHLPAYAKAGLPVAGVTDLDPGRAAATARAFGVADLGSLDDALAVPDAVFDLATPPAAHAGVLERLPAGAAVLVQKPFGNDLAEASTLLRLAREKRLIAAVNFQLRFAPMMLALKDALDSGRLGTPTELVLEINVMTPWHLWDFMRAMPRSEIPMHSIHYLDLVRGLVGEPQGVHARTLHHPRSTIAQSRTTVMLDYGPTLRVLLSINHDHDFGRRFQQSQLRLEGTEGCAVAKLGVLLDYPRGEPDELWLGRRGGEWTQVPLEGTWFPDAFTGPMSNLQRFAAGEDATLVTAAEDAWRTMALVEACFISDAAPATAIPEPAT